MAGSHRFRSFCVTAHSILSIALARNSLVCKVQDDHFIRAVSTGDASLIQGNYDDGVNAIRVTLAADESFKTGRPVSLA